MGASGWSYYVKFKEDINEALQELRWEEFKNKRFYVWDGITGSSPDELLRNSQECGTHSIIDISSVTDASDIYENGTIDKAHLEELFGTDEPDREMIASKEFELQTYRGRWACTFVIVYKNNEPDEIYFTGYSGD